MTALAVLPQKASGNIEIVAPKPEYGQQGRIKILLSIPFTDAGKLHLSSGIYQVECKEIIIRGFSAAYTDNTLCCYSLLGEAAQIADMLGCFKAMLEEADSKAVSIRYKYHNIDRDGLTIEQAVAMARHTGK